MQDPDIKGYFAVGAIAGATISPGDCKASATIRNCSTIGGSITGSAGGSCVGGLLGAVDLKSNILIDSCSNVGTTISGGYGVAGLLGGAALGSSVAITNCNNSASVTSTNTGTGGLVGTVDTLYVMACENTGNITGSTNKTNSDTEGCFGTGGIAGGTGIATLYAVTNSGSISGYVGTGGIVGTSRVGADDLTYNNVVIKSGYNEGKVSGYSSVGGLCGEAQFSGYALHNKAAISASATSDSHVAGICGSSSISLIYNAINEGNISTSCTSGGAISGIVSKSDWASLLTCQNFGDITGNTAHMGGIIGLGGNYSLINFCSNTGALSNNNSDGYVAGIVGELGDQREWSAMNIASCVLGVAEIALGFIGPAFAAIHESATTDAAKAFAKKLHIGEVVAESLVLGGDATLFGIGVAEMLSEEEIEMIKANMSANIEDMDATIKDRMADTRSSYKIPSYLIQSGINTTPLSSFNNNVTAVNNFLEASDANNDLINENFNTKREERLEEIEEKNETKEIIQKVIAGACIIVSTVATIVGTVASGGAFAAVVAGSISAFIGGSNAIVEGVTDFQDNVAIISQCANYGSISAVNGNRGSGIVSRANDRTWIKDCLNSGPNLNDALITSNAIVAVEKNDVSIERCLIFGDNWDPYMPNYGTTCIEYISSDPLLSYYWQIYSVDDLCNISTYEDQGWDIASNSLTSQNRWILNPESGEYPVPYYSEMQEEVEE